MGGGYNFLKCQSSKVGKKSTYSETGFTKRLLSSPLVCAPMGVNVHSERGNS